MEKKFAINKHIWKHEIECSDGTTNLTSQELSRFQSIIPQAKIALPTISVLAINLLSRPEASFPEIMYAMKTQKALTWDKLLHLYKAAEYLKVSDIKKQMCLELLKRKSYSVHNLLEIEKVSAQNRYITLENGTLSIKTGYLKTLDGIEALADKKNSVYQKALHALSLGYYSYQKPIKSLDLSENRLNKLNLKLILENLPALTFIKSHSNKISEVVFPENLPNQDCLIDLRNNNFYNFGLNTKSNDELAKKSFWSRLQSKLPSQESDQFTLGLLGVGLAASGIHAIIPLAKLFLAIEYFEKKEWHKPIHLLFPILTSYPFENAALSTFLLSWVAVLGTYEFIARRARNSPKFEFTYF